MSGLKVYVDLMSQPSRALLLFLKATNIPFEPKIVSIAKRQHKEEDFLKIHKFGKVPAISDNGVNMIESVAILRYLAKKHSVPENWYPRDDLGQARVDEFLEWHHISLRVPCSSYFIAEFLNPMITGNQPKPEKLSFLKSNLNESLANMENVWLKNSSYVTGSKISIADVLGLCEIEQLFLTSFDPFADRPKMSAWAQRLRSELNPHYDEVFKVMKKVISKNKL